MDRVSLDDQGRVLIPAAIIGRLGLSPGMTLVVEKTDTGDVRLRIQSVPPVLVDKGGVLVARVESFSDLTDVARRECDRRVFDLLQRKAEADQVITLNEKDFCRVYPDIADRIVSP